MTKRASPVQPSSAADSEIRGYWRSRISSGVMLYAGLLGITAPHETDINKLPPHVYPIALKKCQELLDWVCHKEREIGKRAPFLDHTIAADLWNLLKLYKPGPPAPPRTGETAQLELQPGTPHD